MTSVINSIATTYPNVYILLTLRSDSTMTQESTEATYMPAAATDATYKALVDSFGSNPNIIFGLSNEPGGNSIADSVIATEMNHGVSVIRYEENLDSDQKHLVSVQGGTWTSDISYYATSPVTFTNVVYEIHYYPDGGYAPTIYSNYAGTLPIIVGEYGGFNGTYTQSAFESDMENDHIPNLAWAYEPFNSVNDAGNLPSNVSSQPGTTAFSLSSPWGTNVSNYILNP